MEPIFDDEISNAIENYEQVVASSLVSMKKKDKSPKIVSPKMTKWRSLVREIHNEISDNGRLKVPYPKAIEEAARRRKTNTNIQNLHKIQEKKVRQNRIKKEISIQTEIPFKPSFAEIYSYKIKKNEDTLTESDFFFEDINKCICNGIVKILDLYMNEIQYEIFEVSTFKTYYDNCNEDTKIFINSLIYTHFDKIFDEAYHPELDIVDEKFLRNFATDSLITFHHIVNSMFKYSEKFFNLCIFPRVVVRKID